MYLNFGRVENAFPQCPQYKEIGSELMVNILKPLRILVADDHELFRHGVKSLLRTHGG